MATYPPREKIGCVDSSVTQPRVECAMIGPAPFALGVLAEAGHADLLLINCNPLEGLDLVANQHKNLVVFMKDGKI